MPVLHKSPTDSHYYVWAVYHGRRMTLQLTPEGVRHLTVSLGVRVGDEFDPRLVDLLFERRWAYTRGGGLGEAIEGSGGRGGPGRGPQISPQASEGSGRGGPGRGPRIPPQESMSGDDSRGPGGRSGSQLSIRMEAHDHMLLDQSAREIIEAIRRTGSIVSGPVPLPTRVERYTVIRGQSSRRIEIRTHKRRIEIGMPTGKTIDALNRLSLPAGVDIRIKTTVAR